jgi:hypothetical protein
MLGATGRTVMETSSEGGGSGSSFTVQPGAGKRAITAAVIPMISTLFMAFIPPPYQENVCLACFF